MCSNPSTMCGRRCKLVYTLLMASHKLRHYLMAHAITIPSSYTLGLLLHNKDTSGQIGKWAAELALFDLTFVARTGRLRCRVDPVTRGGPGHPGRGDVDHAY